MRWIERGLTVEFGYAYVFPFEGGGGGMLCE